MEIDPALARLAGTFLGTEHMHPSPWMPEGATARGLSRCRPALSGRAVVLDYEQTLDGRTTFEGHGIYTPGPEPGTVVLHWFDSHGSGPERFEGAWQGDRLVLQSRNALGHARMTHDHSVPTELRSTMEMSPDGTTWSTLFDGHYQRQDP